MFMCVIKVSLVADVPVYEINHRVSFRKKFKSNSSGRSQLINQKSDLKISMWAYFKCSMLKFVEATNTIWLIIKRIETKPIILSETFKSSMYLFCAWIKRQHTKLVSLIRKGNVNWLWFYHVVNWMKRFGKFEEWQENVPQIKFL